MSTPTPFEKIVTALKLDEMTPAEQEQALLELNELIVKGTLIRLMERMDEPKRDAFTALLEKEAAEGEVEAFLAANVPDADAAVEEAIEAITSDILATTTNN